jgi:hypothetical protein
MGFLLSLVGISQDLAEKPALKPDSYISALAPRVNKDVRM